MMESQASRKFIVKQEASSECAQLVCHDVRNPQQHSTNYVPAMDIHAKLVVFVERSSKFGKISGEGSQSYVQDY